MNPFDPYGLYTNPNQLGVGANVIGDASNVMARNPNVAAQMPQQPTSGLLASGPNMLKPPPMMQEEKADGAGFQGLADAFMKDKETPQQGLNVPQQTIGLMSGQEAIAPNYDFQAPTTFGLNQYQDIGLNQIRPDDYTSSGLGLFLNKFGF